MKDVGQLTPSEAADYLASDAGYVVLDVRSQLEYDMAALPGSVLIPLPELSARLNEIPDKPLIVICHHGIRSMHAAIFLSGEGFGPIYNLRGGIDAWSTEVDGSVPRY